MHILLRHRFSRPIWRIIHSISIDKTLAIETRGSKEKEVGYYFIGTQFRPQELAFRFDWWTGVECVIGKFVVFHHYLQQDLPIHKGITIFDAENNNVKWENEFVTFVSASPSAINVKILAGSQEQFLSLDLITGEEIDNKTLEIPTSSFATHIFHADEPYYEDLRLFAQKYTHLTPSLEIECLETSDRIILGYYVQDGTLYDTYLLVTDGAGEELLHLCIDKAAKGIAKGTFHVSNGLLSFVKDRDELWIISLD